MVTRREWLKLALGAGAGGLLSTCGESGPSPDAGLGNRGLEPEHAVATFECSADSAIASFYAPAQRSALVWIERVDGSGLLVPAPDLDAETGTSSVFLEGLAPDAPYRWRAAFGSGTATEWAYFRTAPAPGSDHAFAFLYSADIDPSPEWDSPIFSTMSSSGAAFFVCLGDWPYADTPDAALMQQRFAAARSLDRVQRLTRAMPVFPIYDDHEVHNDWDAASDPIHVAAALRIWDRWFPLRDRSTPKRRYRSWRWGALAEMFLLDTRAYRGDNDAIDDEQKSMLGAEQLEWLRQGLSASTAPFKLVLSSVPLDFSYGFDSWRGYTTERDALFGFLRDQAISGVLFLSADQHWFAAHRFTSGVREFQVGPLARGMPELPEPQPAEVLARYRGFNYGEVTLSGTVSAPLLSFTCRGATGEEIYTESFAPSDLIVTS